MATGNRVTIIIDADGKAYTNTVEQLEKKTEESKKNIEGLGTTIKNHWLAVSAAIYGAIQTMQAAWNMASNAAQYEQSRSAFKSMVEGMGHDAAQVFQNLRTVSAGIIDNKSLTEAANRALSLGMPLERLGDLMQVARAKARDMGISTTQAFNDMALGIGRGSPMIIDNLGLMLKLGDANEAMARSLHKNVEELTSQEQKLAVLNATLEAGKEALVRHNLEVLTTKEKIEQLSATFENLRLEVGAFILKGGVAIYGIFQGAAAAALFLSGGIFKTIAALSELSDWLGLTSGASEKWQLDAKAAFDAADELANKSQENLKTMFESSATVMSAYAASQQKSGNEAATASKKIEDLNKSLRQEVEKLADEYNRLTMTSSEYADVQARGLIAKGAEIKLVRELTAAQEKLNNAKAAKESESAQARAEESIRQVVIATEKLGASKERLLELEALEFNSTGANIEQIERYIQARKKQQEVEKALEAMRKKNQAEQEIGNLSLENPYGAIVNSMIKPIDLGDEQKKRLEDQARTAGMSLDAYKLQMNIRADLYAYEGDNEIINDYKKYEKKKQLLEEWNAHFLEQMRLAGASQEQITAAEATLAIEYAKKKHDAQIAFAADAAGAMSNIMQNLYVATGSKNKAMFEAMKAFAIAETTIQTYRASMGAYAALAPIPVIGPALAVAAAAAAIAAGMAKVQAIRSQQPGSSATISAGGNATPSYGGGSPDAYPAPQRLEKAEAARPLTITVHIAGDVHSDNVDKLARQLVVPIQKALKDGVH